MPDIVLKNFTHIILFYPDNFLLREMGELELKSVYRAGTQTQSFLTPGFSSYYCEY